MAENAENTRQRDRSPSYPLIPLEVALERLTAFEAHFKRSAARPEKVGDAWGIKAKAYAGRTRAALRYFGLIEYRGVGKERQVVISDEGQKYLRAQQEETRREVLRAAALRPKQIAKFWDEWGEDRPEDAACLDQLAFKNGFSSAGAKKFLKVYDDTISYAGLSDSDKIPPENEGVEGQIDNGDNAADDIVPPPPPPGNQKPRVTLMTGERELTTGLLSKDASFRLIVNGEIGVKEIERLIKKLEFDKEILADIESEEGVNEAD